MNTLEKYREFRKKIPNDILILAVSKTKSETEITELYQAGQRDFGENYVQELIEKHQHLPKDIHWHFIGHLQSNKVKFLVPFIHLIHSVDSMKLLEEINKQSEKINRETSVLIQVYSGLETSKFGLKPEQATELIKQFSESALSNVRIEGLMAMGTNTDDEGIVKEEFLRMKELFEKLNEFETSKIQMKYLSMGMSGDYALAIGSGSNIIRIGSLIFGERNYQNK
jgi:pyridoxal phosphate enzyme (YggS family)